MLQAVILAGGLATRLGPLSQNTPKSLVTVAGRPFLAWQLELLRQAGIERVLLLIGYLGEMIEQYLAEHPVPGLQIDFGREPESQLLGTGGALRWSMICWRMSSSCCMEIPTCLSNTGRSSAFFWSMAGNR